MPEYFERNEHQIRVEHIHLEDQMRNTIEDFLKRVDNDPQEIAKLFRHRIKIKSPDLLRKISKLLVEELPFSDALNLVFSLSSAPRA